MTGSATLPLLCKHATELPHLIPPPPLPAPSSRGARAEKAAVTPGPRANARAEYKLDIGARRGGRSKKEGRLRVLCLRHHGGGRQQRRGREREASRTPKERRTAAVHLPTCGLVDNRSCPRGSRVATVFEVCTSSYVSASSAFCLRASLASSALASEVALEGFGKTLICHYAR